ncbi:fructose-bisphosphate aldolase [Patescibacteria group bacterium]|nr:fructose-bisphosphate aldolase [Patescibacteria group bacterium]
METGKALRLRRIFSRGKAVIIPIDHALYSGPMGGIEDLEKLVSIISKTPVDAILVTPAMLTRVKNVIGNLATVVRIDGTHTRLGSHLERIHLVTSVEHALRVGADVVVINVFVGTENEDELLRKLGNVATDCFKWGLPLMAEMIPSYILKHHYAQEGKNFDRERAADEIKLASRLGAELGADIIKTPHTGSARSLKEVVSTTPVPIVIAGGPKTRGDKDFFQFVKEAIQAGAKGICMGRNVWQRKNIKGMLCALCHIVHENAKVQEAMKELNSKARTS